MFIYIETYGCQMNDADTELMSGLLIGDGHAMTDTPQSADVILLNTCAVRENAHDRIIRRLDSLKYLKKRNPSMLMGICGCVARHQKDQLFAELPFLDIVIGPDSYRRLPSIIATFDKTQILDIRLDRQERYQGITPDRRRSVSGSLTIMRGCDQFCTFCIVPFVRGRERSVDPDEILMLARQMAADGFKEILLLGQTVNAYCYNNHDFSDLLKQLDSIEEISRIRFTSPHPNFFSPKLINTMAALPSVCEYIHLPLQSGSDRILKTMRRNYTAKDYLKLVKTLRDSIPNLSLSTDIIVGFPDESESDFEDTINLVEKIRFDAAFMFHYSERQGTNASRLLLDNVPKRVKLERLGRLIEFQENISKTCFSKMIGTEVEVLIEGPSRRNPEELVGRTRCFKNTVVKGASLTPGDLISATVQSATAHTLIAQKSHNTPKD